LALYVIPAGEAYVIACRSSDAKCIRRLTVAAGGPARTVRYQLVSPKAVPLCNEPLARAILESLPGDSAVLGVCGGWYYPTLKFTSGLLTVVEPLSGSWARTPQETHLFYNINALGKHVLEVVYAGRLRGRPSTVTLLQGFSLTILREGIIRTEEIERMVGAAFEPRKV